MEENQKVILRLKQNYKCTKNTIKVNNRTYILDKILKTSQQDVFNEVAKGLTQDFINGYNCTLLAYGQTGSGKTYTIQGTQHDAGIIQRTLFFIFDSLTFTELKISYVEIYNESIFDLFSSNIKQELEIRENPSDGVFLDGLAYKTPKDYEESVDLFYEGVQQRKTAETKMNVESSRSHSIFTIYLESNANNIKRKSKFHIVDLAGSERADSNYTEERVKESGNINKSLLYLGIAIEKLSAGEMHINYRDSKLTHLLKDCLGGNSKLCVIGCIDYQENYLKHKIHLEKESINCEKNQSINNKELNKVNELNTEKIKFYNEKENLGEIDKEKLFDSKKRKIADFSDKKRIKNNNLYETINTLDFLQRVKSLKNKIAVNTEVLGDLDDIKKEYKDLYEKYQMLVSQKKEEKLILRNKIDLNIINCKIDFLRKELDKTIYDLKNLKNNFYEYLDSFFIAKKIELDKIRKIWEKNENQK